VDIWESEGGAVGKPSKDEQIESLERQLQELGRDRDEWRRRAMRANVQLDAAAQVAQGLATTLQRTQLATVDPDPAMGYQ